MRYSKILLIPGEGWVVTPLHGMNHTETITYNYVAKNGWVAIKLNPNSKLNAEHRTQIANLNIPISIIKPGIPDFICWKNGKIIFIEVKGGQLGLSQVQIDWAEAFSDIYSILVLRVKLDEKEYLKKNGLFSIEGAIIDRNTSNVETLDNLQDEKHISKVPNLIWGPDDLAAAIPATQNINPEKAEEWVYYHLIAMEYADAVMEDAKSKLNQLLSIKNKNPEKYKEAYILLRNAIEKYQRLLISQREKAKTRIANTISEKRKNYILKKRLKENRSLGNIYLKNEENGENFEIQFKTGLEILNDAKDPQSKEE